MKTLLHWTLAAALAACGGGAAADGRGGLPSRDNASAVTGALPPARDLGYASHGGPPAPRDLAADIGATAEQAAKVRTILAAGRERMRAAREATRAELAQVLTPEQLERLEDLLPPPPRPHDEGRRPERTGRPPPR